MPQTAIHLYRKVPSGKCPTEEWLAELRMVDRKGFLKCLDVILELERLGSELEMPHSKPLGGGIFELRTRHKKVRHRIFYFFTNKGACLSHGVAKKTGAVVQSDIDTARSRMKEVKAKPDRYMKAWEK